jgi:1-acyl-sn-glycerol-3-phosphate acyltransferase
MTERVLRPEETPHAPERMAPPGAGGALGRDPFAEEAEGDPFLEQRLDALESGRMRAAVPRRGTDRPTTASKRRGRPSTARAEPATTTTLRPARRRWATTPSLAEIDLPDAEDLLDRLVGEDERRRIAALSHLAPDDVPYDRFGFSPKIVRRTFPIAYALYRLYFRVRSEGHEHIPARGPAVLATNHGGLLPFDGAMAVVDVALNTDPPRLARGIVDRWAGTLPWINVFFARVGQVIGTRENFASLLREGQIVLVFPEGMDGIRKTVTQRHRVQPFHVGFVEQALRCRTPIVPMAIVGSDDQAPILYDIQPLARLLGLPVAPITPTFPWFGPMGLLPYPVSYRIVYGEPLHFHERFGPEGAEDARLVRHLANRVRRAVQALLDRGRS